MEQNTNTQNNIDKELQKKLLERTYDSITDTYKVFSQWLAFFLAAWVGLLTIGIGLSTPSGALILLSGLSLIFLAYELRRAGQVIGGMAILSMKLEREIGLAPANSFMLHFFLPFRGKKMIAAWEKPSKIEDREELIEEISRNNKYSVFHPRRSKTIICCLVIGFTQIISVIVLMLLGKVIF